MECETNLMQETLDAIAESGHTPQDIVFIGSEASGHQCSWLEFCNLADVTYDAGFGRVEVAHDLIVVFSDGQKMWRVAFDGSEEWAYSKPFRRPDLNRSIQSLLIPPEEFHWTLAQINGVEE